MYTKIYLIRRSRGKVKHLICLCSGSILLPQPRGYNDLPNYSHPERQSSSANQPSLCSASLELFARDLLRNQRIRLGLRTGITSDGQVIAYEIILKLLINNAFISCYTPTPNLTHEVRLSRCGATCFPRGVADWLKQSADSIKNKYMLYIEHLILFTML